MGALEPGALGGATELTLRLRIREPDTGTPGDSACTGRHINYQGLFPSPISLVLYRKGIEMMYQLWVRHS